ncbi:MerR family DNA-binding transcriptional regulator [Paenibacillus tarimensis]|uniref:MerR family DNA-binding transcriptional regulator n=1 Tax=Paenibacillus tarimensis TaxID=416012 RepID=UPI001F39E6ED|nr:MerR family DNA-binding transcriptional regulator [Paenibacillus tarimensis]MCF2942760.1 MerR family transcriptional regulator [Paenibacillus tarimensis]
MKNIFSIGETAKINNVSVQALRHYDKIGLLKPSYVNEDSGYRYYSLDQFIYLDIIKYAKIFGIPLKEVRDTLVSGDMQEISIKVRTYQNMLEKQIDTLLSVHRRFTKVAELIEYGIKAVQQQEPYQKRISERRIIKLKDRDEVINFELNSRKIETDMSQSKLEFAFESGYFVDIPEFINLGKESFTSAYMTIMAEGDITNFMSNNEYVVSYIPEGEYVCLTYNEHNKKERIKKMQEYLNEIHLKETTVILVSELYDNFDNQSHEIQVYLHP